jgi:hypothetical protein
MKLTASFIFVAGVLALCSCASEKEREAMLAAEDGERCKSYGLQYGTQQYADCRMGIDQQRTTLRAAAIAAQPRQTSCETSGTEINCRTY